MAKDDDETGEIETEAAFKADGSKGDADPEVVAGLKSALSAERKARQKLETDLARVSGTVEGLKAGQQKTEEAPKTFTRAQLKASVAAGDITEDQMDDILERQLEAKVLKKAESISTTTARASEAGRTIQSEIDKYSAANPDLLDKESDLRARVQAEFDYLVGTLGDPINSTTELKAIRAAIGPLKPQGRRKSPESFDETGGAGGNEDRGGTDDGWAKGLTSAQKAHYQKKIDQGIYKGPTDKNLLTETKYARDRRGAH